MDILDFYGGIDLLQPGICYSVEFTVGTETFRSNQDDIEIKQNGMILQLIFFYS